MGERSSNHTANDETPKFGTGKEEPVRDGIFSFPVLEPRTWLWFGCFSWAKAAEFSWRLIRSSCASQEAWGGGRSPCLGFADAGDWTASQKHAMHTPTMSYALGPTVVALKTISGPIAHVAMNSC